MKNSTKELRRQWKLNSCCIEESESKQHKINMELRNLEINESLPNSVQGGKICELNLPNETRVTEQGKQS